MTEFVKPYDYHGAIHFPLMPRTCNAAWQFVFDWAVAGEALNCAPGDRVLDFAAGSCYVTELLNRLGYRSVALDIEREILHFGRERLTLDERLRPERSGFVTGDDQRLPFADATFDGVICLHAFHHIPDYAAALSEIRRILRPGARAVFSEPGERHAASPESRMVARQFGAVEKNIRLPEIHRLALQAGFERMIVKPYVYPRLVELDYQELDLYRCGQSTQAYTRPDQIAGFMDQVHSTFVLVTPGEKPATSLRPRSLGAQISLNALPDHVRPGQKIALQAVVHNTGDTLWLCAPHEFGGHVALGVKLCLPDGRLLRGDYTGVCVGDALERVLLSRDVPPGGQVSVQTIFSLPDTLEPGDYVLRFDMLNENLAWFEESGAPVIEHHFYYGEAAHETGHRAGWVEKPAARTDTSKLPFVSVIVLGWGGEKFISTCLNALSRQTYPEYEIIVVDNASPDRTAEIVERDFAHVRLIRTEKNLGVAGGNNVGLRAARGDILILTNVDTEARPDWIAGLVQAFQSDPAIGIAGSKLLYPDGTIQHGGGQIDRVQGFPRHVDVQSPDRPDDTHIRDTDFVTGASLAVRRSVLDRVGLEDEAYFPIDYEDPDLCFRVRLAGWRVCYVPQAVSIHYESSTTQSLSPHRVMSSLMGRLRFVCKYWSSEQLRGPFLSAEIEWLQRLQQVEGEIGAFVYAAMPLIYFKTWFDLDDLVEWRARLGVSGRDESRQTLTAVLSRLRGACLPQFQPAAPEAGRVYSPEAVQRMLEQWLLCDRSPGGASDNLVVQTMLALLSARGQVSSHWPIAWPHWPAGIWPKVKAAVQKIVRRLLCWYINPIVNQQNAVNAGLLQALSLMSQEMILWRKQSESRERELCERIETLGQKIDHRARENPSPLADVEE